MQKCLELCMNRGYSKKRWERFLCISATYSLSWKNVRCFDTVTWQQDTKARFPLRSLRHSCGEVVETQGCAVPPHHDPTCAALLWYLCGPLQGTAGGPGGQRYRATLCPSLMCGSRLWLPGLQLLILPAPFVVPLSDGAPLSAADPPSACAKIVWVEIPQEYQSRKILRRGLRPVLIFLLKKSVLVVWYCTYIDGGGRFLRH